jgi:outer membrane protein assembly factor BamB
LINDQIYLLGGRGGQLTCLDAKTGNQIYQDRLPDAGSFWASPWSADGLIYCPDENGNTFVVKPGNTLEVVRVNKLPLTEGSRIWATASAGNNTIFIRSSNTLYAVAKPQ